MNHTSYIRINIFKRCTIVKMQQNFFLSMFKISSISSFSHLYIEDELIRNIDSSKDVISDLLHLIYMVNFKNFSNEILF